MLIAIPLRLFCRGVKNKVIKASQKSERIANMGLAHAIAVLDTLYERHVGKNKFIHKQWNVRECYTSCMLLRYTQIYSTFNTQKSISTVILAVISLFITCKCKRENWKPYKLIYATTTTRSNKYCLLLTRHLTHMHATWNRSKITSAHIRRISCTTVLLQCYYYCSIIVYGLLKTTKNRCYYCW